MSELAGPAHRLAARLTRAAVSLRPAGPENPLDAAPITVAEPLPVPAPAPRAASVEAADPNEPRRVAADPPGRVRPPATPEPSARPPAGMRPATPVGADDPVRAGRPEQVPTTVRLPEPPRTIPPPRSPDSGPGAPAAPPTVAPTSPAVAIPLPRPAVAWLPELEPAGDVAAEPPEPAAGPATSTMRAALAWLEDRRPATPADAGGDGGMAMPERGSPLSARPPAVRSDIEPPAPTVTGVPEPESVRAEPIAPSVHIDRIEVVTQAPAPRSDPLASLEGRRRAASYHQGGS